MKEIQYDGNIFQLPKKDTNDACLVTTNGIIRKGGKAVMGAGIARYCRDMFYGVDKALGRQLKTSGNHVHFLGFWYTSGKVRFLLFSFPTKDDWKENSKPELIRQSCREIMIQANEFNLETVYMPCPGCSNGKLDYWSVVRPILRQELDDRFVVCIPEQVMKRKNT